MPSWQLTASPLVPTRMRRPTFPVTPPGKRVQAFTAGKNSAVFAPWSTQIKSRTGEACPAAALLARKHEPFPSLRTGGRGLAGTPV
jgi:hypothetical protein